MSILNHTTEYWIICCNLALLLLSQFGQFPRFLFILWYPVGVHQRQELLGSVGSGQEGETIYFERTWGPQNLFPWVFQPLWRTCIPWSLALASIFKPAAQASVFTSHLWLGPSCPPRIRAPWLRNIPVMGSWRLECGCLSGGHCLTY